MNRAVLLAAVAMVPLLFAQNEAKAVRSRPPDTITRMIRLQHADPRQVRDLLVNTGAQVSYDNMLRVVVVSGTPSDVASLEQAIRELDAETARLPSPNVEMTVYVVGASPNAADAGPIPSGLQSTVNQLKQLFPYGSYQLLETTISRARVGEEATVQGTLQPFRGESEKYPATYRFQFTISGLTKSGPSALVHVQNFDFTSNVPFVSRTANGSTYSNNYPASVRTNIDIATGQKVVVGKAGAAGSNAMFLIVEAKVVD